MVALIIVTQRVKEKFQVPGEGFHRILDVDLSSILGSTVLMIVLSMTV
jgi:hypothetical protein